MPDVTELLNQDHRTVEQLFAEFESNPDHSLAMQICDELLLHATVEEELVYPALAQADADLEKEAEKEHAEAEQLIDQIQAMSPDDQQLVPLMRKLQEAVQHHVEEEESQAWPKLRSKFADKLDDLGAAVEERKQQLSAEESGEGAESGDGEELLDLTRDELYERAKKAEISGASDMTKQELAKALSER